MRYAVPRLHTFMFTHREMTRQISVACPAYILKCYSLSDPWTDHIVFAPLRRALVVHWEWKHALKP